MQHSMHLVPPVTNEPVVKKKTIRKTDWFDTMVMKTQKDQQKQHLNARKPAVLCVWGVGGGGVGGVYRQENLKIKQAPVYENW